MIMYLYLHLYLLQLHGGIPVAPPRKGWQAVTKETQPCVAAPEKVPSEEDWEM
jgi:hypothetical protein